METEYKIYVKKLFAQIKKVSIYGNRPLSILCSKNRLPQYARQVLLENLLRRVV
ncbi:MAG: hypothetical protein ABIK94_01665 [candidate division WOR-3 bacterium]